MNFDDLKLAPAIVQAVREHGYETPTPIQAEAIPAVLAGRDLLGGAQTGTGKTAAFTLPMLHRLSVGERAKNRFGGVAIRALVLTPTRELAAQVEESVRTYGKHLSLTSTVIFGGVGMNPQINAMKRGVDILVATPGRLLDLQQQGFLDLAGVQMLVLDEADRMLDMGFIHDVKKILALVPKEKQSLLFSATFSDEIRDLANNLLKDPLSIQVTPRNTTVQRITQVIHPVGRGKKKALLVHIINEHNWSQVLVFTRTKFGANNVAEFLTKNGIQAMALHGNKSQGARTQALAGFKSGDIRALVATDIAARGIDIDELPHVVNYEIPNVSEDYVHRIGRTGRAGKSGEAINLVSLDEEGFMMDIERFTKQQIPVQIFPEFMPEPGEKAEPIAMGRQTIWGGAGKPPSRDVMAAAAKAARTEMMQRVREKKADAPQGRGNGGGQRHRPADDGGQPEGQRTEGRRPQGGGQRPQGNAGGGNGQPRNPGGNRSGAQGQRPPRQAQGDRMDRGDRPERGDRSPARGEGGAERQPGPNAHLGSLRIREPRPRAAAPGGQPDPLRTSIDSLGSRGARNNRSGQGQGRGGPGRNNDAPRGGPADPLRTNYGRIR
ncbi:MAG: DEAD/DEAH box helicase [Hydrogenophaga sp.]|uniref:DEAD/DEAH box helicase n=1 Tax=Hydrogenophaga sp. TaxID=1904254 RepID=UPI00271B7B3D|nr:DEAD/DEAH box helicase [Hydrogenophaga sp.]MDO9148341.1 DEAD/DEAH box helicase [Hydrogenophaga sp.]MDO9606040.1 DEAD/DEAH box helicase [Hydrogenophaga sp.]MDP3475856.1 DEAD/DEAH box helicase [Hydrogenophaga sp.]